jgi:hypothetical protein
VLISHRGSRVLPAGTWLAHVARVSAVAVLSMSVALGMAGAAHGSSALRGEANGVIIQNNRRGTVISFHREARRAFAKIAGRPIKLSCVTLREDDIEGVSQDGSQWVSFTAPKRRRPFFSPFTVREGDLCSISRRKIVRRVRGGTDTYPAIRVAVVPLTPKGARYIAEANVATRLDSIITAATFESKRRRFPTFGSLHLTKVDGVRVVPLATADATPPAGKLGYFSDGTSVTAAGIAIGGRRLFITRGLDGFFASNVLNYLADPAF